MDNRVKGIIMATSGPCLWGIMGIFIRNLGEIGFSSYEITFLRCLLAGMSYFIFKLITEPSVLKINIKDLIICVIYGVVSYSVSFISYTVSIERIPVSVATVLMFMSPVWVTLLGLIVFKEKMLGLIVFKEKIKTKNALSILGCIIGACLVSNIISLDTGGQPMDLIGILAGILNGFGVALQIMIPRYFSKRLNKDTMLVYGFLGAAAILLFTTDFKASTFAVNTGNVIFNIFMTCVICTMVANVSFVKSTQYIGTTTSSILSALEVVVGAVAGFLILNENLSILQIIGAVIVVCCALGPNIIPQKTKTEQ